MVINPRMEGLNFQDNDIISLKNNLIAFERLQKKYEPIIKSLLRMYECEKCGECCRKERVSSGMNDLKRLKKFNEPLLRAAIDEVKIELFTLKVPCQYLNNNNSCKCYEVRPIPCTYYPFIFVYGYFISIAYCPYGMKIIKDIIEYCKLKGILIEDIDEPGDCSNVLMKDIITEIDNLYKDLGLERKEEDKTRMLNVPFSDLEDFYKWIKAKRKIMKTQKTDTNYEVN